MGPTDLWNMFLVLHTNYNGVTWASWRLKFPANWLFAQQLLHVDKKENIKAPQHWPFVREHAGGRRIPVKKGQYFGLCFLAITSTCDLPHRLVSIDKTMRVIWLNDESCNACIATCSSGLEERLSNFHKVWALYWFTIRVTWHVTYPYDLDNEHDDVIHGNGFRICDLFVTEIITPHLVHWQWMKYHISYPLLKYLYLIFCILLGLSW